MTITNEVEYKQWTKKIESRTKAFVWLLLFVAAILCFSAVLFGLNSFLSIASIVVFVLLCIGWLFYLNYMVRIEHALRIEAYGTEERIITNPIFQEIYDEFLYDRFEGVIQKGFFENWKLDGLYDDNKVIDIIYTKKEHEISLTISDEEVSIIIDEETNDPIMQTIPLEDERYMNLYVLFEDIAEFCEHALGARNRALDAGVKRRKIPLNT